MTQIYLQEDYSSNSPANFIQDELHTVQSINHRDYYIIVPMFFPFYENNIHVWIENNGVRTLLNKHTEYELVIPYTYGEVITGRRLYCAISIFNKNFDGTVRISYQAFGGKRTANRKEVLRFLADKVYNLREANWNQLVDKPLAFPPSYHFNYFNEVYGQDDHVQALSLYPNAINQRATDIFNLIAQNLLSNTNGIAYDAVYVNRKHPAISNPLLVLKPVNPLDAGNVNYVQTWVSTISSSIASIAALLNNYLDKGNDTANKLYLNYTPTDDLHAANLAYLQSKSVSSSSSGEAPGVIRYFLSVAAPTSGYLMANSAWVPISAYPNLFNVIGHTYDYTNYIINIRPYENLFLLSPNSTTIDTSTISFSSFVLQA
jgi:hypothetical protein